MILGRQPEISVAELEAQGWKMVEQGWQDADGGANRGEEIASDRGGKFEGNRGGKMEGDRSSKIEGNRGEQAVALVENDKNLDISRFGGIIKTGVAIGVKPLEYLAGLPEGKITFGLSDYDRGTSGRKMAQMAMRLKRKLREQGRSVRVVESPTGVIPSATTLYNGLYGKNPRKVELMLFRGAWYCVTGVQDIDAYAKRDQNRPARDVKIGMLPPKLAQVLINLACALPLRSRILDPFCGTGVVLQEAILMNFRAYGTDIDERMIRYSRRNLEWLAEPLNHFSADTLKGARPSLRSAEKDLKVPQLLDNTMETSDEAFSGHFGGRCRSRSGTQSELAREPREDGRERRGPEKELIDVSDSIFEISLGDATSFRWEGEIDAVVTEGYLGEPMSRVPTEVELRRQKEICGEIALGFLRNLAEQIETGVPVVMCLPAWRRPNGEFERLKILDEIENLGYNVSNKTREGLIYHRVNQIVARDLIILRKK